MTLYEQWQEEGGTIEAADALLSAVGQPLHPIRKVANALTGLRRDPSAWHLSKLDDWMQKVSDQLGDQPTETEETGPDDDGTYELTAEQSDLHQAPPATPLVVTLRARAKALHKEQAHQHALLTVAATDEERQPLATDIMERIVPALDRIYDRIRALQAGEADPYPDPGQPGAENLTRALQNARSRMSRLKGKIKGEKDPATLAKLNTERTELEAEIQRLIDAGA